MNIAKVAEELGEGWEVKTGRADGFQVEHGCRPPISLVLSGSVAFLARKIDGIPVAVVPAPTRNCPGRWHALLGLDVGPVGGFGTCADSALRDAVEEAGKVLVTMRGEPGPLRALWGGSCT